jgi:hypothetical protein
MDGKDLLEELIAIQEQLSLPAQPQDIPMIGLALAFRSRVVSETTLFDTVRVEFDY